MFAGHRQPELPLAPSFCCRRRPLAASPPPWRRRCRPLHQGGTTDKEPRVSALVCGLVTRDVFVFFGEAAEVRPGVFRGYGGILHALAALGRVPASVCLVTSVDVASAVEVAQLLSSVGVDKGFVRNTQSPLPRCSLFWAEGVPEPVEQTTTGGACISQEHLAAAACATKARFLYANLTAGHDLERRTLQWAREVGLRIYLDPHMLLYGMDAVGARFLDPPDDWREWLRTADVVQLNSVEYGALCARAGFPTEPFDVGCRSLLADLKASSGDSPWGIVRTSRDAVWVGILIDHAFRGVLREVHPIAVPHAAYTVGCGDAFGAGVFAGLTESWTAEGLLNGVDLGIRLAAQSALALGVQWHHPDGGAASR